MITMIARVMDVWLYCHSVSRAMFCGRLSDLGLGLGGLYLENIDLDSSDNFFTLIVCFAMFVLLSVSGGYHCRKRWSGMFGFLFLCTLYTLLVCLIVDLLLTKTFV